MGSVIATLCAAHGYRVALHDNSKKVLETFVERARPVARYLAGNARDPQDILRLVEPSFSLEESVQNAFLVHEVIQEDLKAKRDLLQRLDALCPDSVMLATNTSSFLLTDLCQNIRGRQRVIGIHYVSPAHVVRAVEIIVTGFTDQALIKRARQFVASIDHIGIVCREQPGFLINRIHYALKAECQRMVDEGIASVEDIDTAVRLSLGPRFALWGPLMSEDLSASKKTVLSVTEYIHKATGDAHYASSSTLRSLADSGQHGAVSGAGWYKWGAKYEQVVIERDRQLGELLDWLRHHERLTALGVAGENDRIREVK